MNFKPGASTTSRVTLGGDWTNAGVIARLSELTTNLESLFSARHGAGGSVSGPEICLLGIESIDASGCQLLDIYFQHLRRYGFTPVIVTSPDHIRSCVEGLGFNHLFERAGF